jgi:HEPN domain-containing protein
MRKINPLPKMAKEWFDKAAEDIKAAEILLAEDGPTTSICFHAQQAAEKSLKGYLTAIKKNSKKIHDLVRLVNEIVEIDKDFKTLLASAAQLNPYYIESRYPTGIPFAPSLKIAKEAVSDAEYILGFIKRKLNIDI